MLGDVTVNVVELRKTQDCIQAKAAEIARLTEELAEAKARKNRLEKALRKYCKHAYMCECIATKSNRCTCGLDEVLQGDSKRESL